MSSYFMDALSVAAVFLLAISLVIGAVASIQERRMNSAYTCHDEHGDKVYLGQGHEESHTKYFISKSKYDNLDWYEFPNMDRILASCSTSM